MERRAELAKQVHQVQEDRAGERAAEEAKTGAAPETVERNTASHTGADSPAGARRKEQSESDTARIYIYLGWYGTNSRE